MDNGYREGGSHIDTEGKKERLIELGRQGEAETPSCLPCVMMFSG